MKTLKELRRAPIAQMMSADYDYNLLDALEVEIARVERLADKSNKRNENLGDEIAHFLYLKECNLTSEYKKLNKKLGAGNDCMSSY